MTRRAIAVTDDRGMYQVVLGAHPAPWGIVRRRIEDSYGIDYLADHEVSAEPLWGWGRWTWAVLVNGETVCFVDGDEPRGEELPFARGARAT